MRKTYPRAVALTVGTAMMLINGVVYAWSIYSVPFSEGFGWSSAQLGVCFTVMGSAVSASAGSSAGPSPTASA